MNAFSYDQEIQGLQHQAAGYSWHDKREISKWRYTGRKGRVVLIHRKPHHLY